MEPAQTRRAIDAAVRSARTCGLPVDDAVLLHDSDRIAVRLRPGAVLARVAPGDPDWRDGMAFEVEAARLLAATDAPVGPLDPRVRPPVRSEDGFTITFWKYYPPVPAVRRPTEFGMDTSVTPEDYLDALRRFHVAARTVELAAPHILVRVDGWIDDVVDPDRTPELPEADRELVLGTLRRIRAVIVGHRSADQLLHGEPHPDNLLHTAEGPIFIDLGTCQRGPIEYDLSYVPADVAERYPGADPDLVRQFRVLMYAGVAAMRWGRTDQYPDRDHWRVEMLRRLRAEPGAA